MRAKNKGDNGNPKFKKIYKHRKASESYRKPKFSFPQQEERHEHEHSSSSDNLPGSSPHNNSNGNSPRQENIPPNPGDRTTLENTPNPEAERRKRNIEVALQSDFSAVGTPFSLSIKSVKKIQKGCAPMPPRQRWRPRTF